MPASIGYVCLVNPSSAAQISELDQRTHCTVHGGTQLNL